MSITGNVLYAIVRPCFVPNFTYTFSPISYQFQVTDTFILVSFQAFNAGTLKLSFLFTEMLVIPVCASVMGKQLTLTI